ncbi:hypothetical protein [Motiliproteus sediminis]|uniref:hypothetical protein n=1 Tax=Motiliproteus sediminis TaxID=1468178 RepID=UPI001AEFA0B1|nr:hypothetical protein [Motiliproteus sediminis]
MKSYQFFTADGRGGTMLCDDDTLEAAVSELSHRFKNVVKVQIGKEVWEAPAVEAPATDETSASQPETAPATIRTGP